jgi:hypothetical protein
VSFTKCSEGDVCHLLDDIVNLLPDDSSLPRCCGIDDYLHPDLIDVQVVGLKGMAAVDGNQPIVAKLNESAQELLWEPRAMSARGT